jgi:uncharacterized membrane protein
VKTAMDPIQTYLRQLEDAIEVLGPKQSRDTVNDVRTHPVAAVSDIGGDETQALARFGPPERLAYQIEVAG